MKCAEVSEKYRGSFDYYLRNSRSRNFKSSAVLSDLGSSVVPSIASNAYCFLANTTLPQSSCPRADSLNI